MQTQTGTRSAKREVLTVLRHRAKNPPKDGSRWFWSVEDVLEHMQGNGGTDLTIADANLAVARLVMDRKVWYMPVGLQLTDEEVRKLDEC